MTLIPVLKTRTGSLLGSWVIMPLLFLLNTSSLKRDSNTAPVVAGKNVYTIAIISDIHPTDPTLS